MIQRLVMLNEYFEYFREKYGPELQQSAWSHQARWIQCKTYPGNHRERLQILQEKPWNINMFCAEMSRFLSSSMWNFQWIDSVKKIQKIILSKTSQERSQTKIFRRPMLYHSNPRQAEKRSKIRQKSQKQRRKRGKPE